MTYATIDEWLGELENYGTRFERIPEDAMQWIETAWKLGAQSAWQWRPIETAPKDGTPILLYCADCVGAEFGSVIGFWSDDDGGDWYASEAHSSPLFWAGSRPTHWMPLPEGPR